MFKRRPEYFAVAVIGGVVAVAASVITALSLDTGINAPGKKTQKSADEIVVRAASLTSGSDEEIKIAKARVEDGLISCGDYVISVMTSPEYLLQSVSDEKFAKDLCYVVHGDYDAGDFDSITRDLQEHSRAYVIDRVTVIKGFCHFRCQSYDCH